MPGTPCCTSAGIRAGSRLSRPGATRRCWNGTIQPRKQPSEKLQPLLVAPSDRRVCAGLDVAAPQGDSNAAGVYVVTHVDVVPPKKDEAIVLLNDLASASRKDAGVSRFDVWQQASRPNHSYVVEAWRDDAARDAHVMAGHTRAYRTKLLPLEGSLYDERIYDPVR